MERSTFTPSTLPARLRADVGARSVSSLTVPFWAPSLFHIRTVLNSLNTAHRATLRFTPGQKSTAAKGHSNKNSFITQCFRLLCLIDCPNLSDVTKSNQYFFSSAFRHTLGKTK